MTKTARDILASLTTPDDWISDEAYEEGINETLKELEAIMLSAAPTKVRQDQFEYDSKYYHAAGGRNEAIEQYEARLLTALYGKESK